jgi:hypothetical protein
MLGILGIPQSISLFGTPEGSRDHQSILSPLGGLNDGAVVGCVTNLTDLVTLVTKVATLTEKMTCSRGNLTSQ